MACHIGVLPRRTPVRKDLKLAIVLGLAGLVPFWALALAYVLGPSFGVGRPEVAFALSAYAATIASFLGGIRWGIAVRDTVQPRVRLDYFVSVVPQLISWGALLLDGRLRFLILATVLLVSGPLDYRLVARGQAPLWFGRLRIALSLAASASLFLAAAV